MARLKHARAWSAQVLQGGSQEISAETHQLRGKSEDSGACFYNFLRKQLLPYTFPTIKYGRKYNQYGNRLKLGIQGCACF